MWTKTCPHCKQKMPSKVEMKARSNRERVKDAVRSLAGDGNILSHEVHDWASITFSGARHRLLVRFEADAIAAGERFVADLPQHEFAIPKLLIADAGVANVRHEVGVKEHLDVTCEILALEDR